jgi:hypothetical protein
MNETLVWTWAAIVFLSTCLTIAAVDQLKSRLIPVVEVTTVQTLPRAPELKALPEARVLSEAEQQFQLDLRQFEPDVADSPTLTHNPSGSPSAVKLLQAAAEPQQPITPSSPLEAVIRETEQQQPIAPLASLGSVIREIQSEIDTMLCEARAFPLPGIESEAASDMTQLPSTVTVSAPPELPATKYEFPQIPDPWKEESNYYWQTHNY